MGNSTSCDIQDAQCNQSINMTNSVTDLNNTTNDSMNTTSTIIDSTNTTIDSVNTAIDSVDITSTTNDSSNHSIDTTIKLIESTIESITDKFNPTMRLLSSIELLMASSSIISTSTSLLDLNCGHGIITELIHDEFPNLKNIVGLDNNVSMLISAEKRDIESRPKISYELGTNTNFIFSEKFDVIFYHADLSEDQQCILNNCYNNIVTNGHLIFCGYVNSNVPDAYGDIERIATSAGFKIINLINLKHKSNHIKNEIYYDNNFPLLQDKFNTLLCKKIIQLSRFKITKDYVFIYAVLAK